MESSITIKVGDEEIILSNTEEYKDFLKDENVRFLRDTTNKRVGGFGSLVIGGRSIRVAQHHCGHIGGRKAFGNREGLVLRVLLPRVSIYQTYPPSLQKRGIPAAQPQCDFLRVDQRSQQEQDPEYI